MRVPHGGSVLRGRQWWAHVYLQRASSFLLFFLLPWWMNAEPSSWRRDLCILLGCPSFGRPAAEGPFSDSCWRREDLLPRVFFSSCVRGRFLPWQKVPCNLKPQFWPLLIQSQHGTKKKLWGECLHHQLGELMVWIQQPIFSPQQAIVSSTGVPAWMWCAAFHRGCGGSKQIHTWLCTLWALPCRMSHHSTDLILYSKAK